MREEDIKIIRKEKKSGKKKGKRNEKMCIN